MRELNNTKIIAVDHGYGNIKTVNTVTPTGIMGGRIPSQPDGTAKNSCLYARKSSACH